MAAPGEISLAHGGMMAIGAYTSALLMMRLGFSSWATLVIAGIVVGIIASLVAYPFVKLRGVYFSMATIFFGEVVRLIFDQWRSLTNGTSGLFNIPRPAPIVVPWLMNVDFATKADFYYFVLILVLITLLILYFIEHSSIGLTFFSIAQSNSLAESVGIDVTKCKVIAFSIGCFFAGIAGAFYGQYMGSISPEAFGFFFTINIVIYMIVGGSGRFVGPIVGALVLTIVPELFRTLKDYEPFVFSIVLILIIFLQPQGLVGMLQRLIKLVKKEPSHA